MRIETRGRARALQALYAWDIRGAQNGTLLQVAERAWDDLAVSSEERAFASRLIRTIARQQKEIDGSLAEVTSNWRLERIGAIERCVLRLGAAEFAQGETPTRVVLREAVRLAERYGTAASARFVNGVLDAVARRAGLL
ncbi:MAG TPA: transcription antitermination factor NusB [Gemmatimonadaceae bacterium]|nr:transcription antitermination factor NusB [Gemmatimonadaceae bacterium]